MRRMSFRTALSGSSLAVILCTVGGFQNALAQSEQTHSPAPSSNEITEIVVTAQKRSETINSVGMSITAATGDELLERGVLNTADLVKVVPGFTYNETAYGTPVYTLRGVGFQENTLSAGPTVSIYMDEVPIPFSGETEGATLDLARVEVLKGPQGTLYGENSTGGAINYIAARPTTTPTAGFDASYGRFNTTDLQGFVSGPIANGLTARLSGRMVEGDGWQQSYTRDASLGAVNKLQGRALVDWEPSDNLAVTLSFNIWSDRSEDPAQQFEGIHILQTGAPLSAALLNYPVAPANARAADWDAGATLRRNNIFYQGSARIDYSLPHDLTATSITAFQRYTRNQPIDEDGTALNDFSVLERGNISTVFQELRLSGGFPDGGNWIVGGNYESDDTFDNLFGTYAASSIASGLGFPDNRSTSKQDINTYAVYGDLEHDIVDTLSVKGGVRYTRTDRTFDACGADGGDGLLSGLFTYLEGEIKGGPVSPLAPGACVTFNSQFDPGPVHSKLDEDNLSWRAALDWKPQEGKLFYVSVSKGFKSGSFPTLPASTYLADLPVTQESVLAYEAGEKVRLLDDSLQLNGAIFYYDYSNKQIRGFVNAPPFGNLAALANIPQSHIQGFELSGTWLPVTGLTITPAVTLVQSRIDGHFENYTPFSTTPQLLSGEAFPYTPKWSANVAAEYKWGLNDNYDFFVGGDLSYQDASNAQLGDLQQFKIKEYMLLDLRAGVESKDKNWRLSLWGRNVTNQYYWTSANYVQDTYTRYAGMPATYGVNLSYRFQ